MSVSAIITQRFHLQITNSRKRFMKKRHPGYSEPEIFNCVICKLRFCRVLLYKQDITSLIYLRALASLSELDDYVLILIILTRVYYLTIWRCVSSSIVYALNLILSKSWSYIISFLKILSANFFHLAFVCICILLKNLLLSAISLW